LRYRSNYGCAHCLRLSNCRYQQAHREELLPKKRKWAKDNPEKNRAQSARWQRQNWSKAYAIQQAAKRARWDEHYRLKGRTYRVNRRAALLNATPPWVDLRAIDAIYRACPVGLEVDHIVPLNGRGVCGLHVPWNLQYLTKSANCSKGLRYANVG
jgi:hypothetical protein